MQYSNKNEEKGPVSVCRMKYFVRFVSTVGMYVMPQLYSYTSLINATIMLIDLLNDNEVFSYWDVPKEPIFGIYSFFFIANCWVKTD